MSAITKKHVEEYAISKTPETITIECNGHKVNVKTNLSLAEQIAFTEGVVKYAYINSYPSKIMTDAAFEAFFVMMFTDIELPVEEDGSVDIKKSYNIAMTLNVLDKAIAASNDISELIELLKSDIEQRIQYQNQKLITYSASLSGMGEVMETINSVLLRGADLINMGIGALDTVNPKTAGEFVNMLSEKLALVVNKESEVTISEIS